MTVPTPLERQVRQNTNDVLAIYELIHGIDRKISGLDVAVSTVVGTQLRHGQRLDAIDQRLDAIDDKLDRLNVIDDKLGQVLELLRQQ